jgi:hypothetical protein
MLRQASNAWVVVLAGALFGVSSCASLPKLHWPVGKKPAPPAAEVQELEFSLPDGGAAPVFAQYWQRNTLVIDMQSAAAAGTVTIKPATPVGWPVRLAFRVRPGSFAQLEVLGEQRVLLPIAPAGAAFVDLPLAYTAYSRSTPQIELRWGAAQSPPEGAQ